ncbi:MAG: redoxin domain-containing protein [Halioglobus sp.]|nr:redoxin domain-containing protein [Halioglobus sp.]
MITILVVLVLAIAAAWWFVRMNLRGKPAPLSLQPGQKLPTFRAQDESGNQVSTADLAGKPAVILFVRGNWCPFCTRQVEDLTAYYKEINDLGAHLILITPKPLSTTRRVAEMFGVEFDFWLDPDLAIARQLGLVHTAGVPGKYRNQYGTDTVWPTSLVVDADGVVRYTTQSRRITDRPDPQALLTALRRAA